MSKIAYPIEMDKNSENVPLPDSKDAEDKDQPGTSTIMKPDDSDAALGDTGIIPTNESKSTGILPTNESESNEPEVDQQPPPPDSLAISDLQRETHNKTPEELIEEVKEEVNKLNISEQEIVVDETNESLKNVLVYNSDSSDVDDSEGVTDERLEAQNCDSNKNPMKLNFIMDSSGSSDSDSEDSAAENNKSKTKLNEKSNINKDSDTSDTESDSACTLSSDSDSNEDNSDSEVDASVIDIMDENIKVNKSNSKGAVKKTNITGFEEADCVPIPDISNLKISDEIEFMHIGSITYIIAEIITVTVIPGTPAFDLDSMLFIECDNVKKPMGAIFDVIGPVSNPIYCVRFNSEEDIVKLGLKSGTKVFAAPKSEEFTKFVFLSELLKMKYSDASYRNDTEVPLDMAEFSDDEKEREARRKKAGNKRKINDHSLERHKKYEQNMNKCNSLNTKLCKMVDIRSGRRRNTPQSNNLLIPPEFDPTVPPPGFERVVTSNPMDQHYAAMLQQQQSMYAVYQGSPQAMQNAANAYASQLDFANAFGPPTRDHNPSQNPPVGNNYLRQHFTVVRRNNRGPGPSSQPY